METSFSIDAATHLLQKLDLSSDIAKSNQTTQLSFLDLPGEIRNRIYEILLCSCESEGDTEVTRFLQCLPIREDHVVMDNLTRLRTDIDTSILLVNKSVYEEARFLMRKTNRYVKINVRIPFELMLPILVQYRLPVMMLSADAAQTFNEAVLEHQITFQDSEESEIEKHVVILGRDMEHFMDVIMDSCYKIDADSSIVHTVIYLGVQGSRGDKTISLDLKLREEFISSYSSLFQVQPPVLLGFEGINVDDIIQKAAGHETCPNIFEVVFWALASLVYGNAESDSNPAMVRLVSLSWLASSTKRLTLTCRGKNMLAHADGAFADLIARGLFTCYVAYARAVVEIADDDNFPHIHDSFHSSIYLSALLLIDNALAVPELYAESLWVPDISERATVQYLYASTMRKSQFPFFAELAESSISSAIALQPNDAVFENERVLIQEWKDQVALSTTSAAGDVGDDVDGDMNGDQQNDTGDDHEIV